MLTEFSDSHHLNEGMSTDWTSSNSLTVIYKEETYGA